MSQPIIEVRNLTKRYHLGAVGTTSLREEVGRYWDRLRGVPHPDKQDFLALREVSFDVQPGEVVGVIGRNGAGKSTLLKILSRITEPTSGYAKLRGRVASLLEVGTGFHPELTGRENIFLNGAILGMNRAEVRRKFDEIVTFAEVDQFIDTPVKRYSSGMYVRLAFAVAAHLEPEVLIVDEVLAVGDAQFQKKCLGKIQSVASNDGRTVLFVSHNISALMNLCTRGFLLEHGALVLAGHIRVVVDRYLSTKQAKNVFQPSPERRNGDGRARIVDFQVIPQIPRTGIPVEFIFTIRRTERLATDLNLEVAISFLSEQDAPLYQLFSQHTGFQLRMTSTRSLRVIVAVKSLPLVPGNYRANLWLGTGHVPMDWIQDSFVLSVSPGKIGGQEVVESRGYPVVTEAAWSSCEMEPELP